MRTSKSSSLAEAKLNKPGTPLSSVIIIDFGRWRRCGSRLEIGTPLAHFLSSRPAQPAQPTHEVIHTGGATHPPPPPRPLGSRPSASANPHAGPGAVCPRT